MTFEERHAALAGTVPSRVLATGEPCWLSDPLVSTEDGRARLRRYALAGMPTANASRLTLVAADAQTAGTLRGALAQFAPPVAHHVVQNAVVAIVGGLVAGMSTRLPRLEHNVEQPHLILLDAREDLPSLFAHEAAHAWLHAAIRPLDTPATTYHECNASTVLRTVASTGTDAHSKRFALAKSVDEWQAIRLARSWGFVQGFAVDEETAGATLRAARRALELDCKGSRHDDSND